MAKVNVPGEAISSVIEKGPKVSIGKRKQKEDPEATDSDSDLEDIKVSKKAGQR